MVFKSHLKHAGEYLAVFLGNPGTDYQFTRHNVGFMTADRLADMEGLKINKSKFRGLWCRWNVQGTDVILLKPLTYMNLSGESVRDAAAFFKIPHNRIIVIFDDISMPLGKLRLRGKGSAGGHNGIKSIIQCLSGDDFPRIKIGVGSPPHPDYDMADWVLGKFSDEEKQIVQIAQDKAIDALKTFITQGLDKAMNLYNS